LAEKTSKNRSRDLAHVPDRLSDDPYSLVQAFLQGYSLRRRRDHGDGWMSVADLSSLRHSQEEEEEEEEEEDTEF